MAVCWCKSKLGKNKTFHLCTKPIMELVSIFGIQMVNVSIWAVYLWSSYIFCTSVQTLGIWRWIRWRSRNYLQWRKSYSEREARSPSLRKQSTWLSAPKLWMSGKWIVYYSEWRLCYLWQGTLFGQSALVHFFEQLLQCIPDGRMVPLFTRQILQLWVPMI